MNAIFSIIHGLAESARAYKKLIFWVLFASALLFVVMGVLSLNATLSLVKSGEIVEATVVEVIKESGNGGPVYRPVFEFQATDGATHKFTSNTASYPQSYFEGDKTQVIYLPGKPDSSRVYSTFSLWGWPIACGVAIVSYLVLWIVLSLTVFRKPKSEIPPENAE